MLLFVFVRFDLFIVSLSHGILLFFEQLVFEEFSSRSLCQIHLAPGLRFVEFQRAHRLLKRIGLLVRLHESQLILQLTSEALLHCREHRVAFHVCKVLN